MYAISSIKLIYVFSNIITTPVTRVNSNFIPSSFFPIPLAEFKQFRRLWKKLKGTMAFGLMDRS